MYSTKEVQNDFLSESREDLVGLWSVIWRIKNEMGENDPLRVQALSVDILRALLNDGLIKAGVPNDEGEFVEWCGSTETILTRIKEEWDHLGREPDIGDV